MYKIFKNKVFKRKKKFNGYNITNRGDLDEKPVSLIAKCCYKPPSKFNVWLGRPL
jgi:hypothetical protein